MSKMITVLLQFECPLNLDLPIRQVKDRIHYYSLIAKSTSPWLLDHTFFAHCILIIFILLSQSERDYNEKES